MATNDQAAVARTNGTDPYEIPTARRARGMIHAKMTLAAGVPQHIGIGGDYFHVLTAPVNDLQVRFDDGKLTPCFQGVGYRAYYDGIELSSATGQTVEVLVGFGSVFDGRATANVNVTANVTPGANLSNGGDVSCIHAAATQLLAADPTRLYALIANPSTNTLTMRLGTSAVAAATGIPIEPGTTLPIATKAAIYAYNPDPAVNQTLSAAAVQV